MLTECTLAVDARDFRLGPVVVEPDVLDRALMGLDAITRVDQPCAGLRFYQNNQQSAECCAIRIDKPRCPDVFNLQWFPTLKGLEGYSQKLYQAPIALVRPCCQANSYCGAEVEKVESRAEQRDLLKFSKDG